MAPRKRISKYEVVKPIWSNSQERYFFPGDIIELDDETAKVLFDIEHIKPAVIERDNNVNVELEKLEDGTNN